MTDSFDAFLAEAARNPPLLIPGTQLAEGKFVVRNLLGTGGMGAVYRATDTRHNHDLALKVLSRVEPEGIYRLKQEFRSLANVHHPNLVALHELHSDRDTWFLTMDLVAGQPLSKVTLAPTAIRDLFRQIAEAVHAIHQCGKLHRDLKPSNVMLTPASRIVVLDFGLASELEPGGVGQTLTDDGFMGTFAYMAPEQITERATAQSDWYAFGTMLYEALFNTTPFPEQGFDAMAQKCFEPVKPPQKLGVPEDLTTLCLQLLERSATGRAGYEQIAEVLGAESVIDPAEAPRVEREQLEALERALDSVGDHSVVVIVSGPAGSGKTSLIKRFLASQQGVALAGRCPQNEHVPLRACDSLIDDLSRYLRAMPTERAAAMLPDDTHALTQLFPVLDRIPAVREHPSSALEGEVRRLGFTALQQLVERIAARERLVLFVDDLQWSDLDGANLLASLVPTGSESLLLVVAHRTNAEEAPGLAAFVDRIASSKDVLVNHLRLGE